MKVAVKSFDVEMDVKTNGIEFGIWTNQNKFIGDLIMTKTQLIWCEGKTNRKNGKKIAIEEFREFMNGR